MSLRGLGLAIQSLVQVSGLLQVCVLLFLSLLPRLDVGRATTVWDVSRSLSRGGARNLSYLRHAASLASAGLGCKDTVHIII